MAADDDIKFGILKCRDLVALYYGARMVVSVNETEAVPAADGNVLGLDPRRIRLQIVLANEDPANTINVDVGNTATAVDNGQAQEYRMLPNTTQVIERSFLTDFDAVTLPVFIASNGTALVVSIRETFLTPAPVDEIP